MSSKGYVKGLEVVSPEITLGSSRDYMRPEGLMRTSAWDGRITGHPGTQVTGCLMPPGSRDAPGFKDKSKDQGRVCRTGKMADTKVSSTRHSKNLCFSTGIHARRHSVLNSQQNAGNFIAGTSLPDFKIARRVAEVTGP